MEIFARSFCEIFLRDLRYLIFCEAAASALSSASFAQCFNDDVNHRPFAKVLIEAQRSVSHGAERHAPDTRTRRQSGGGHFISKSLLLKITLRLALGRMLPEVDAIFGIMTCF